MSLTVPTHSPAGKKTGTVDLDEQVFGIEPNMAVLHEVVTAQLAARRSGSHSTKTRAQKRGGGRKPWRQKGTGRARQGSIRSPQFTGGGVAHGPKPRSYAKKVNRKAIRIALCSALSDRAASERIKVVDGWKFDTPSTSAANAALDKLSLEGEVLLVLGDSQPDQQAHKSFRNLPNVSHCPATELNAYDILRSDWLVFTADTLGVCTERASAPVTHGSADEGDPVDTASDTASDTAADTDEAEVSA